MAIIHKPGAPRVPVSLYESILRTYWRDRETLSSDGYDHHVSSGGGGGKPRTTIIKDTDHPQSHTSGDLDEEARTRAYSILASSRISFHLEGFVFLCL